MYKSFKAVGYDLGKAFRGGSDVVSGEFLGAGGKVMSGKSVIGNISARLDNMGLDKVRKLHTLTDDIFRVEDGAYIYRGLMKEIDALEPNVAYQLKTGRKTRADILKRDDGKIVRNGKVISDDDLSILAARASKYSADSWLVNYADQANFPAMIRANRLVGASSPHYTWQFNATPVPGRSGILGKLFTDDLPSATVSPAVNSLKNRTRARNLPMKAFTIGLEKHMLDSKAEVLRMANSYYPGLVSKNAGVWSLMTNPLVHGWDSTRAQNFGEPLAQSLFLLKNLSDLAGFTESKGQRLGELLDTMSKGTLKRAGYSANRYINLTSQEKSQVDLNLKKLQRAVAQEGKENSWSLAASVGGIAGSNLIQLMQPFFEEGKEVNIDYLIRSKAMPILLTGFGAKAVDTMGLAMDSDSALTGYKKYGTKASTEQVSKLKYLLNVWTGMSNMPQATKRTVDRAAQVLAKDWDRILINREMKQKIRNSKAIMNNTNSTEEEKAKAAVALRFQDQVSRAIRQMKREFKDLNKEAIRNKENLSVGLKGAAPMAGTMGSEEGVDVVRTLDRMNRERGKAAEKVLMQRQPGYRNVLEEALGVDP